MPVTVLTWNIHHAAVNGHTINGGAASTVAQRFGIIHNIAANNAVDVVALQEVPANANLALPMASPFTMLAFAAEQNPNTPRVTNTSDGYLILVRTARFNAGVPGFYQAGQFRQLTGAYLRAPYGCALTGIGNAAGTNFNFYTWHAEPSTVDAQRAVDILDALITNTATPTVIAGDLNLRQNYVGQRFAGWTDLSAGITANVNGGKDHILRNGNLNIALANALQFTSDGQYHFPIAASF